VCQQRVHKDVVMSRHGDQHLWLTSLGSVMPQIAISSTWSRGEKTEASTGFWIAQFQMLTKRFRYRISTQSYDLYHTWHEPRWWERGSTVVKVLRYKSEGSIPNGVKEFLIDINPADHTMALGSTQPLTEMSTGSISLGYTRPVRKVHNLTTILCRCQEIWEP
jgi:hypothetical protein